MQYEDKLLDHNYDGIQELDNSLPPWWLNLFYLTIIWGIAYFFYYHVFGVGDLQVAEYNNEMGYKAEQSSFGLTGYRSPFADKPGSVSESQADITPENAVTTEQQPEAMEVNYDYALVTDAGRLENGAKIYTTNCVSCHGANGEGGIGPNLTDNYWLHDDGNINGIIKIVVEGVAVKGMISWKPLLSESDIVDVSSYIFNLRGTNPANPKAPQGEKYGE